MRGKASLDVQPLFSHFLPVLYLRADLRFYGLHNTQVFTSYMSGLTQSLATCRLNYKPKETRPYLATEGAWVHFRLEYVYSVLESLWL